MNFLEEALEILRKKPASFAAEVEKEGAVWKILRTEHPLPATNLWEALESFDCYPKFYWEDKTGETRIAAMGKEWEVPDIPHFTQSQLPVRFYGALHFDEQQNDPLWQDFFPSHFFLPSYEIIEKKGRALLAVNRLAKRGKKQPHLSCKQNEKNSSLAILERGNFPEFPEWEKRVIHSLNAIQEGLLEKIVLARRVSLRCNEEIHALHAARLLQKAKQNSYLFLYQKKKDLAFFGASPEKLYKREGSLLSSEAVAGTRIRGKTAQEDDLLQKELLNSNKDIREFLHVKKYIENALSPYCQSHSHTPGFSIVKTASVQHLYSSFAGVLSTANSDSKLLASLHPTPATLGVPKERARSFLRQYEKESRGLYAAPIGWVSSEGAEFAVGIRSCLIHKKTMHLFSAAGIVEGSDPALEWEELESKLQPILTGIFHADS